MNSHTQTHQKPALLSSVLSCKCPRCRQGDMFETSNPYNLHSFMRMHEKCPVCSQPFNMEPGFYYGTSIISYALTFFLSVATFGLWFATIGMSLNDNRVFWWIGFNAVVLVLLQPPMMRISRTIWLSFFVRYNKNWKQADIVHAYT